MEPRKRCLIITGGTVDLTFTEEYVASQSFDVVIAVDKGLNAVHKLGLKADYILGDFDSVDKQVLMQYQEKEDPSVTIRTLNPVKDMTDTEDAIELAMTMGATEIVIVGATGTRLDHVLANINLLMKPLKKCVKACILDKNNQIYLHNKDFNIERKNIRGKYVSFLPLTSEVTGVTLSGFKYPLHEYTLTIGNSLGVSNEIVEDIATVSLKTGILIVIESRD